MNLLQDFLSKLIALASGYIAASIWIVEDNSYIKAIPFVLLILSIKLVIYDINNKFKK